jgi:autotransporter adhesin
LAAFDQAWENTRAINRLNDKFDNGMAMGAALSGLPQAYGVGRTQISAGMGLYEGNSAIAIGLSHRSSESVVVKGGAAWATEGGDGMFNLSVGYEF